MSLTLAAIAATLFFLRVKKEPPSSPRLQVADVLAGGETAGFARATSPRKFVFPADHGPHPDFRTEWWYVTGNLTFASGERFGIQLTFFRSTLQAYTTAAASQWRTNQIFMAHFAVTDVRTQRFYAYERFERGANGLAGAAGQPVRVWLGDWSMEIEQEGDLPVIRLTAREGAVRLDLSARSEKPLVLQGDAGLSQKGSMVGNASYYYSITRMKASGSLSLPDRQADVTGTVWMDREWSTSALEETQSGWDWFSIQLDDGFDIMYYQLRRNDGTTDPSSRGALINRSGEKSDIQYKSVTIEVLDHWASPRGGDYPSRWRLVDVEHEIDLEIEPLVDDQELDHAIRYWEGAVRVSGTRAGRSVGGYGYVELTGYAGSRTSHR
jgi:predicted secreted hydrolase